MLSLFIEKAVVGHSFGKVLVLIVGQAQVVPVLNCCERCVVSIGHETDGRREATMASGASSTNRKPEDSLES